MATAAVTEEIASNLEEVAQATRRIDTRAVGFFTGGAFFGIAVGFFFGYRFNREKIKAEAFKQSEEEVEKIREIYQQKVVAAQPKPSVEEVVEEKGYSVKSEPEVVIETRLKPVVPVAPPKPPAPVVPPVSRTHKSSMLGWDYDEELANRDSDEPYVIHQDERGEHEGYNSVAYTYWAIDDVLTDEDNRPLPHAQEIVGLNNLKFGHGTDNPDVVFVRNETLDLEMEIERVNQSYEQEILGLNVEPELEHSNYPQNRQRKRKRRT